MKKIYLPFVACCLLMTSPLFALYQKFEIRTDAFVPSEKLYRQIYGQLNSSYQAEASISNDNIIETFINFDWHSKQGKSTGCGEHTRINVATGAVGVKFQMPLSELLTPYFGAGIVLGGVHVENHTCLGRSKKSHAGYGYLFKSGVVLPLASAYFLDLFIDYVHLPVDFHKRVNVGGLKVGFGIGVNW